MIISVVDKDTGKFLKRGDDGYLRIENGVPVYARNVIQTLLAAGHTRVESEPPSSHHKWLDGTWVLDAELQAASGLAGKRNKLAASDSDMARLSEDLIDILVGKGLISLNDFPDPKAIEKLLARKALRG